MGKEFNLNLPITESQVRELKVGDIVYLNGIIVQMRSPAHARAAEYFEEGRELPFNLSDGAVLHGFSCNKKEEGSWQLCYLGPTLSYRMSKYAPALILKGNVRVFIGKAGDGMSEETSEAMQQFGCVHLSQGGGVTAYNTSQIVRLIDVYWEDLAPDHVFAYEVKGMGPLIVTMDTFGQNLYSLQQKEKEASLKELLK